MVGSDWTKWQEVITEADQDGSLSFRFWKFPLEKADNKSDVIRKITVTQMKDWTIFKEHYASF